MTEKTEKTEELRGKVAEVVDQYTLLINRGSEQGVEIGDIWSILDINPIEVRDPDTQDIIGTRYREKLRVKVTSVDPRYCTAETYRKITVESGYKLPNPLYYGASPQYERRVVRESLEAPNLKQAKEATVVQVQVGDLARKIAAEKFDW